MTEPSPSRPVPGPLRPGPQQVPAPVPADERPEQADVAPAGGEDRRPFAALEQRPVAEHVAVFEAEHARLQDELSTIDRL